MTSPISDQAAGEPHPSIARAIAQEERACRAEDALIDLVNQIRKSNPVDDHGHDLKMNRAYLEAMKLLDSAAPTTGSAPGAAIGCHATGQGVANSANAVAALAGGYASPAASVLMAFDSHEVDHGSHIEIVPHYAQIPALTDDVIWNIGAMNGIDRLTELLDDDQWNEVEPLLMKFARALLAASMGGDRK